MNRNENSKIEIVVFQLEGCAVCDALEASFNRLLFDRKETIPRLKVRYVRYGDLVEPYVSAVQPRLFPTVILFVAEVARLGWEGFATFAPGDVQDLFVLQAFKQIEELSKSVPKGD